MSAVEYPNAPSGLLRTAGQLALFFWISCLLSVITVAVVTVPLKPLIVDLAGRGDQFYAAAQLGLTFAAAVGLTDTLMNTSWSESTDDQLDQEVTVRIAQLYTIAFSVAFLYILVIMAVAIWSTGLNPSYAYLAAFIIPIADRALAGNNLPSIFLGLAFGIVVILRYGGLVRDIHVSDLPLISGHKPLPR